MKRLYLIITLICPAAFAQEQQEIGIGGSPMVGGVVLGNSDSSEAINIAAMPDGSVWYFSDQGSFTTVIYCHVNEDGNPRCEQVDIDD